MNQMRMDAEGGGRVIHRSRRGGMLAMVVAMQNLLVIACLVVTFHFSRDFQLDSEDIVHIQFHSTSGSLGNETLQFSDSYETHMVEVSHNNTAIEISCTGPYIWYMEVCYASFGSEKSSGTLQLQVKDRKDPVYSFPLNAKTVVCRRLHSTVYLKAKEVASLYLLSEANLYINNMTMGLSYLLGSKCYY